MMTKILKQDAERYESISRMPRFQKFLRKYQTASNPLSKLLYRVLYRISARKNHIEIPRDTKNRSGIIYRASILYNDQFQSDSWL